MRWLKLKYILVVGDHFSLVFVASLLAVAGGDGRPGGAAAGVIDRINHGLSPGQRNLQLDPRHLGSVQLRYGLLCTLNPLVGDKPTVLLHLHGDVDNLPVLSEGVPAAMIRFTEENITDFNPT